jgi:glycosyltransferase involved in cell wall biosynthesis
MKISMIVLNPFTHDARVKREAATLVKEGHQVTVNALWEAGLATRETLDGIMIQRIRLRSREGGYIPLAAWFELVPGFVSALRAQKPEVVHAHDLNGLIPGFFASRWTGATLIYDAHEFEIGRTAERSGSSTFRRWAWRQVEGALIGRAAAVITVSGSISKELSRIYGIRPPVVVMNCPELIDLPAGGRLRTALDLPAGQPVVLFQGVLTAGRGLETAVRALAQVPQASLVMVGDGPLRGQLETLADELRVRARLKLCGKVPLQALLDYTRDASIGLCLTENTCLNHYYSLPNKLFEYLMVGVPVFASDFPDMRQVVEDSGAGIVADPGNAGEIARLLNDLLSDPQRWSTLSQKARQSAETRYNWEVESRKLLAVYQDLTTGK